MRTNTIISLVLAFVSLTAQVSATYGAPQANLPTTNNSYEVNNSQVPTPYKESKPAKSYKESKPTKSHKEVKPAKASKEAKPAKAYKETGPVKAKKETKPAKAYKETRPAKANNGSKTAKSTYKESKPAKAYKEAKTVKSHKEARPAKAYKDARPAKSQKAAKPAKTNNGGYGGNGSDDQVVPLIVAENDKKPQGDNSKPVIQAENDNTKPQGDNTKPVIQVDPVPANTKDVAPAVDASKIAVDPVVQPAAARPNVAPVAPVYDSVAGPGVDAVTYKLRR
ncbi:hypothetical protein HDU80_008482 [Chytriomyces hyalinus]|nr:hypothetical protein HDU80_008482 [Chytriomyces hyalinus]